MEVRKGLDKIIIKKVIKYKKQKQLPLGRKKYLKRLNFLRVRVKLATHNQNGKVPSI